jgi:hypothetical protein
MRSLSQCQNQEIDSEDENLGDFAQKRGSALVQGAPKHYNALCKTNRERWHSANKGRGALCYKSSEKFLETQKFKKIQ